MPHAKPSSSLANDAWWVDGDSPASTSKLLAGQSYRSWRLVFDDVKYGKAAATELILNVPTGNLDKPILTAKADVSVEGCKSCSSGVCTYLDRDTENCGKCGDIATSEMTCVAGKRSCTESGRSVCGSSCVDLQTDENNCGACGTKLNPNEVYDGVQTCERGAATCRAPRSLCSGSCVDLQTDESNCGTCGNNAPAGAYCAAGVSTCSNSSYTQCSTGCVDLDTDENNCGACGDVCPSSASFCQSGLCLGWRRTDVRTPGTARTCDDVCRASGGRCAPSSYYPVERICGNGTSQIRIPIADSKVGCTDDFTLVCTRESRSYPGGGYYADVACPCEF